MNNFAVRAAGVTLNMSCVVRAKYGKVSNTRAQVPRPGLEPTLEDHKHKSSSSVLLYRSVTTPGSRFHET